MEDPRCMMMSQDLMPSYLLEPGQQTPEYGPDTPIHRPSTPNYQPLLSPFHGPTFSPSLPVVNSSTNRPANNKTRNANQEKKRGGPRSRSTSTARQRKTPASSANASVGDANFTAAVDPVRLFSPPPPAVTTARGKKFDETVKKINERTDRLEQKIEFLASKVLLVESILKETGHQREIGNGFLTLVEAYNKKVLAETGNVPGSDQQKIARIICDYRKQCALLDQRVIADVKDIIQGVQAQMANEIQSINPSL